jgi:hypothetical protein
LKGRYIGECTRLIFDLIERAEEENIPVILLLLDFEKAFDTVEWSFLFFGFGKDLCNWVKTFNTDQTSCILNNDHCSDFFDITRGVRQGDPLSPYLFILVMEILNATLKNDPIISGIKFNDSEYLASQYADDTSLTLEDDPVSLERRLQIFDKFGDCAGLRANLDKTQAVWFGSGHGCGIKYLPHCNLLWNHSGKFKVLGIEFDLGCPNKVINNFHTKFKKVKSVLNSWIHRELSYVGKITVIKTLALPILAQVLSVLPNPPKETLIDIQNIFFRFLWNNKRDKIKRKVIMNNYEEGGLKLPHIESYCYALKMSWIQKLLNPMNHSQWKLPVLLLDKIEKIGYSKKLEFKKSLLSLTHFGGIFS